MKTLTSISYAIKALCNFLFGAIYLASGCFSVLFVVFTLIVKLLFGIEMDIYQTGLTIMCTVFAITYLSAVKNKQDIPFPFETDGWSWLPKCTWIVALLLTCSTVYGQPQDSIKTIERHGKVFVQTNHKRDTAFVKTNYVWTIINGDKNESFDIYINKNSGRCVYYKVSKKTGKPYPVYIPADYAMDIAKEMGINYKTK